MLFLYNSTFIDVYLLQLCFSTISKFLSESCLKCDKIFPKTECATVLQLMLVVYYYISRNLYFYCLLSFDALFSSFPLAESLPRDLQITAYK